MYCLYTYIYAVYMLFDISTKCIECISMLDAFAETKSDIPTWRQLGKAVSVN
jgi:hypothetical protein